MSSQTRTRKSASSSRAPKTDQTDDGPAPDSSQLNSFDFNSPHAAQILELSSAEQDLLRTKPGDLTEEQRLARRKIQHRLASSVSRNKKRDGYNALAVASTSLVQDMQECKNTVKSLRAQVNDLLAVVQRLGGLNAAPPQTTTPHGAPRQGAGRGQSDQFFRYSIDDGDFTPNSLADLVTMGVRSELTADQRSDSGRSKSRGKATTTSTTSRPSRSASQAHLNNIMLVGGDDLSTHSGYYDNDMDSIAPSTSSRKSRSSNPSSVSPWELAQRFQAELTSVPPSTLTSTSTASLPSHQQGDQHESTKCLTGPVRRSSRRLVAVVTSDPLDSAGGLDAPVPSKQPSKRNRAKHFYPEDQHLQQAPPMPLSSSSALLSPSNTLQHNNAPGIIQMHDNDAIGLHDPSNQLLSAPFSSHSVQLAPHATMAAAAQTEISLFPSVDPLPPFAPLQEYHHPHHSFSASHAHTHPHTHTHTHSDFNHQPLFPNPTTAPIFHSTTVHPHHHQQQPALPSTLFSPYLSAATPSNPISIAISPSLIPLTPSNPSYSAHLSDFSSLSTGTSGMTSISSIHSTPTLSAHTTPTQLAMSHSAQLQFPPHTPTFSSPAITTTSTTTIITPASPHAHPHHVPIAPTSPLSTTSTTSSLPSLTESSLEFDNSQLTAAF